MGGVHDMNSKNLPSWKWGVRSKNIRQMYQILVTCDGFEYKEVKKI